MTSSMQMRQRAQRIIDQIAAELDEAHLAATIDEPIERVADQFIAPRPGDSAPGPVTHAQFHAVLAQFTAALYEQALPCRRSLSRCQALEEAISLLQSAYEGPHAMGYAAAAVDARGHDPSGLGNVLARLADIVKNRRRQAHVAWVFAHLIDPGDWQLRCQIASIALDQLRPWLPDTLSSGTPERFADDIPMLMSLLIKSDLPVAD